MTSWLSIVEEKVGLIRDQKKLRAGEVGMVTCVALAAR